MRQGLALGKLRTVYGRVAKRYDRQHSLTTAGTDQRGRELLVQSAVEAGDRVLDCGAGTGSTGILAARRVGPNGHVTMFDLSEKMLDIARGKIAGERLQERATFATGDMVQLPFADGQFDVVLSTYSLCPLYDPARGALELLRVTKPGGRLGIAHSVEPANRLVRWLGDLIESVAWRLPALSMGCRAVRVLPVLERAGCRVVLQKRIGVPLWPFIVFVVEKPPSSLV